MIPQRQRQVLSAVVCCWTAAVLPNTIAFTGTSGSICSRVASTAADSSSGPLQALTDRQQQFWEDVESGLDDIESFYQKKLGMDIDRVRQFGRSARGEVDPPKGAKPGHDPSEEHVDGLTPNAFWDTAAQPEQFPWAQELEANSDVIQKEFEMNLKKQESQMFASDSAWQNQVMGGGWSAVRLQRLGVWNEENCRQFPETYELIRSLNIPLAVRGVCFARQAPGSGVQPHTDGRNFILTSHLGLKIPKDCWIEVGTERRGWEEGKLTTLDTSFTHSTGNPSTEDRHVLIIDFWHPELTEAERAALEFVYDLRNGFDSGVIPYRRPRGTFSGEKVKDQEEGTGGWWSKVTGG